MQAYRYYFLESANNEYVFETENGSVYLVEFKPSPYLIEKLNASLSEYVFELVIGLVTKGSSSSTGADGKIGTSVAEIVENFFSKSENNVIVFICETKDNKQLARLRKFNQWFLLYHNQDFVKFDEVLVDKNDNRFPISLIMKISNPFRIQFVEAFFSLASFSKD